MVPWIWMLNNKKKSSSGISAALHSSLWNFWQICFLTIGFSQNQCVKIRIHCLLLYKKIPKIWDFMEVCFQCGGHSHLLIHFVLASSPVLRAKKILCNLKNWFFSHECCYRNLLSLLGSEERHPFFGAVKTQVSQSVSQSGWCYNCYWIFQDKIFVGGGWNFSRDMETKWEQCGWHVMISIQIQMWCASCINLLKQALILSSSRF